MPRLPPWIRRHLPFIIIAPLLIIVMTWPALPQVFDSETIAFPTRNYDVWQKLWDVWHGVQFLAGKTSFYHTDAMFYPVGLSLAYENFNLPHMLAVGLLGAVLPISNAYTLTHLLIVFAVAFSGYLYLNYLFRDRWLATLGAIVFGISQHVIAHAAHPDVNFIVSFPLAALCFQRAIAEERVGYLLGCGIITGLTAFISLYIFICLLITLAFLGAFCARDRWKDIRFWRWMLLLGSVILLFSAGRLLPIIADSGELADALEKNKTDETGSDLLSYFVNYRNPVTTPLLKSLFGADSPFYEPHTSYLGYLPLALVIIGLLKSGGRRAMWPWLAIGLLFLLLRLGSVLQVDGEQFSHVVLPKALLADLLPMLFSPFHIVDHFQMGVLLPLAVLSCFGLKSILASRTAKQRALITLALIAVVAFEYYERPAMRVMPAGQFAFIDWLREESQEAEPRLINLPMGRQPSKLYGFYQTLTGFPQVEGLTGRTPPAAYDYIEGNFLLKAWRAGDAVLCFPPYQSIYVDALDKLIGDGFTHVVWHHRLGGEAALASSFVEAQPAYSDDYVRVYRLEDLHHSCDLAATVNPPALEALRRMEGALLNIAQPGSALLSILSADHDQTAEPDNAAAFLGLHRYSRLALEAGEVAAQPVTAGDAPDVADLLANYSVVLLVYDPQTASADAVAGYRAWLATRFNSCGRPSEAEDAVVEFYLEAAFPCELALAAQPLEIRYDNGMQLGNLLVDGGEDDLRLYLLWTRLPEDAHVVSIQLLDADGERVLSEDFVIGSAPLAHYLVDASSLRAYDYRVNLIVYNYASGVSVGGEVIASREPFARELELARLKLGR